jgi:hypothetical protein
MERVSRILVFFFTLLVSFGEAYSSPKQSYFSAVKANDFSVFEENGKVGLKDHEGQVLIPAQYDAMGWSNGEFSLINNTVTGYRTNGLWGLVNIQNNRITKAEFEDLSPGGGSLIVARKKLTGSVRVRAGCINASGKEVIPFQYDGLRISSFRAIVYTRIGNQFKHGLIDFENKILIPVSYQNIYPLGSLRYGVENFESKTAIFSEDGKQITNFLIDSLSSFKKDYAILYQKQRQGLIDRQGQIRLEPTFREIRINDDGSVSARQPDAWLFLDGENKLLQQYNADSVVSVYPDLLKILTAEKIQLTDKEFKPLSEQLFSSIASFKKGRALFRTGNKTGVIDHRGNILIKPLYNSLLIDPGFIRANQRVENKNRWIVLDSAGNSVTTRDYEFIGAYNGRYFPVKNRGYWGALSTAGKEIVACVHDSLVQQVNDLIIVKFKSKYGIINLKEDWIVTPQSDKLHLISDDRYLLITSKTTFLKSISGNVIYFSDNRIEIKKDHLLEYLPSGTIWKIDMNGVIADRSIHPQDVDEISAESEGLRAIKKDARYGFIDSRGRLRIANRYEDVKDFSDGLAAARIRGKWGFINHEDKIAIQPVYDNVAPFRGGLAQVTQKNLHGLIDKTGRLILPVRYDSIVVLPGQRFQIMQNNLWGLAESSGKTVINPKYDHLNDLLNGYVIVERDGKFGLLTLQGLSTIPLLYDGLTYDRYHQRYIALRKSGWETVQLE